MELFVNGVSQDTGDLATPNTTGTVFRIGTFNSTSGIFNGKIYLARLYNKVLTSAQVLHNFNAQRYRFGL